MKPRSFGVGLRSGANSRCIGRDGARPGVMSRAEVAPRSNAGIPQVSSPLSATMTVIAQPVTFGMIRPMLFRCHRYVIAFSLLHGPALSGTTVW